MANTKNFVTNRIERSPFVPRPKPAQTLEWHIGDEEMEWDSLDLTECAFPALVERSQNAPAGLHTLRPWLPNPFWHSCVGAALLVLLAALGALWQQAQSGYREVEEEIAAAVALETWRAQTGKPAAATMQVDIRVGPDRLPHPLPNHGWQTATGAGQAVAVQDITVRDIKVRNDLAMVTVAVAQPLGKGGETVTSHTTRFYRWVGGSWQRTAPAHQFWGERQHVETKRFVLEFGRADHKAVLAAAARLDDLDAQLRRDFGLDTARSSQAGKQPISVSMQRVSELPRQRKSDSSRIIVESPMLQPVPDNLSHGEILTHAIAHHIVLAAGADAQRGDPVRSEWIVLMRGLQLWQTYTGSTSLAAWQQAVGSWLFQEAPSLVRGEREPTRQDVWILCRTYAIWGDTLPWDSAPVLLCIENQWQRQLRTLPLPPEHLHALVYNSQGAYRPQMGDWWDYWNHWMASHAAVTVVDYLVHTYGRERLPALVDGMRRFDSWEELAPHVAGVSAAQFNAGWQAYIATTYATSHGFPSSPTAPEAVAP